MDNNNKNIILENMKSDQIWTSLRIFQSDIDRIADGGLVVDDGRDLNIVQMVFHIVAGELHLREARILDLEAK